MIRKHLLALLLCLVASVSQASISLEGSTDALELVTTGAGSIDYDVSWSNVTATALTTPGTTKGNIATATTTTIVAAPSASNWRYIRTATFYNASTTVSNTLTIQKDVSATNRLIAKFTLSPGEQAMVDENGRLTLYTSNGVEKVQDNDATALLSTIYPVFKGGTANTAGYYLTYAKDTAFPTAYALQSPGLNGFATDCSIASQATNPNGAAQMGAHLLPDPTSGSLYLTQSTLTMTVAQLGGLIDLLWYNTALSVTTVGAQAITPIAAPARDIDGTTNGKGVYAGILVTATLGNGLKNDNTITYTDQDGTAGNTGTLVAFNGLRVPATAQIGMLIPFTLAAGDSGVRSIESYNNVTTMTSGSISLVLYRTLASIPVPIANVGYFVPNLPSPGIKIHPNTCIWQTSIGSASATNLHGSYVITEK